jgi:hypothetical protein
VHDNVTKRVICTSSRVELPALVWQHKWHSGNGGTPESIGPQDLCVAPAACCVLHNFQVAQQEEGPVQICRAWQPQQFTSLTVTQLRQA